jgi:hypothetical protein
MKWHRFALAGIFAWILLLPVARAGQEGVSGPARPSVPAGQHQDKQRDKTTKKETGKGKHPAPAIFHPSERASADTEIAFPADI